MQVARLQLHPALMHQSCRHGHCQGNLWMPHCDSVPQHSIRVAISWQQPASACKEGSEADGQQAAGDGEALRCLGGRRGRQCCDDGTKTFSSRCSTAYFARGAFLSIRIQHLQPAGLLADRIGKGGLRGQYMIRAQPFLWTLEAVPRMADRMRPWNWSGATFLPLQAARYRSAGWLQ